MCGYFHIGFINFMLNNKRLAHFTNLKKFIGIKIFIKADIYRIQAYDS